MAVTHLSLTCVEILDSAALLKVYAFPSLIEIGISATKTGPWDLNDLFQTIHGRCSPELLKSIHVDAGFINEPLMPSILDPLYVFRHLTTVFIDVTHGVQLEDDNIKAMALAWPHLQALSFYRYRYRETQPTGLPLHSLLHLLRHCPDLHFLCLDIDASNVNISANKRPGAGIINKHVQMLNLSAGSRGPADPVKVAAFLLDIFPRLRRIAVEGCILGEEAWRDVERLLPVLNTVRKWAVMSA